MPADSGHPSSAPSVGTPIAEIVRRKRDGLELNRADIDTLVGAIASGQASDGQIAAFAMSVYFQGMSSLECATLTHAMAASGERLRWDDLDLDGPCLDKHSTGGVGDKVSLILAPMLAACGAYVPMISGRGLGHTGGTLDKLEAIPGYNVSIDTNALRGVTQDAGCAIVGATAALAPADARTYAVRDVTATVDSLPLVISSILSKKLAAGTSALVMDVKVGSGAFTPTLEDAQRLAESLVTVACDAGLPTTALITDMNQVLGASAGNALEVHEAIAALRGEPVSPRLMEITIALGAQLLVQGGLARDVDDAQHMLRACISDGRAAERFERMVVALGGPANILEQAPQLLPQASVVRDVFADEPGFLQTMDTRAIGLVIIELGGGRRLPGDALDLSVGFDAVVSIGTWVDGAQPLARVHAPDESSAGRAASAFKSACSLGPHAPERRPSVYDTVLTSS
jgi:thymidine phosphorylase